MTMCDVKGIAGSDRPTENYHLTLQCPQERNSSDWKETT